jgi:NAD(P)H-hydrate epimerase
MPFVTENGTIVPAVTAEQMREVDRIAVEAFGLGILQMMENAGRNLAENVLDMLGRASGAVTILAGAGGNGGGGLCCGRHLHNHGVQVWMVLDTEPDQLGPAAANQLHILRRASVSPMPMHEAQETIRRADIVVDALIGYGLQGSPTGRTAELIEWCNELAKRVLALDVPSGLNATTGEAPGVVVGAERTLTLALPKTGLAGMEGELYLGDIGIPMELYKQLDLSFDAPFRARHWVRLSRGEPTP